MNPPPVLLPTPRKCLLRQDQHCDAREAAVNIQIRPGVTPPQGYRLTLGPAGVQIVASDEAGAFYARQTLAQLRSEFGDEDVGGGDDALPQGEIEDWPDFAVRGVMLDISRDKV